MMYGLRCREPNKWIVHCCTKASDIELLPIIGMSENLNRFSIPLVLFESHVLHILSFGFAVLWCRARDVTSTCAVFNPETYSCCHSLLRPYGRTQFSYKNSASKNIEISRLSWPWNLFLLLFLNLVLCMEAWESAGLEKVTWEVTRHNDT